LAIVERLLVEVLALEIGNLMSMVVDDGSSAELKLAEG